MRLVLGVVVTRVLRGQGQAHRFFEIPEERSGFFLRLRQNARVGKRRPCLANPSADVAVLSPQ